MKRIAVIVNSRYGQTEKIGLQLRFSLLAQAQQVELFTIKEPNDTKHIDLGGFDAVIIGAPVFAGAFSKVLEQWVRTYSVTLNSKACGFFTVSGNAADKRPEARAVDDMLIQKFLIETGLKPQFVASFGGAIQYTKYNFFLRWMMKRISAKAGGSVDTSKDQELTDWALVGAFAKAFGEQDLHSRFAANLRLGKPAMPDPRHLAGRPA